MIRYEEQYHNEEEDMITFYFFAPKEMLRSDYPDAVSATIALEFPADHVDPSYASVSISPTREVAEGCLEDYDWCDYDMTYEEIEQLLDEAIQ